MSRLVSAVVAVCALAGGVEAVGAQRGQPLPPPTIKDGVTQKIAEHVYELQARYDRNQMASAIRAAYNEAQ